VTKQDTAANNCFKFSSSRERNNPQLEVRRVKLEMGFPHEVIQARTLGGGRFFVPGPKK